VLDVSVVDNTVTVGPAEALDVDVVTAASPVWCGAEPVPGDVVGVQVRAHGAEVPATVEAAGEAPRVRLHAPQRGVAPGQTVVLYDGTRVVGSATISAATSAVAASTTAAAR
jgi:tRNA-specific 2-thiouridylase